MSQPIQPPISPKPQKPRRMTQLLQKLLAHGKRNRDADGKASCEKSGTVMSDLKNAFGHINPRKTLTLLGAALAAVYLLTGIYIVNPGQYGVVRRFGKVIAPPVSEGLHYRLPWPVDQVQKVNMSEVRRADVGMTLPDHIHSSGEEPQPIQLLTGDENIITVQGVVHYQVEDAVKYLYNVNGNSENLVRYSVESALVEQMANMAVDDILSTGKVEAQNSILALAQQTLQKFDAGIRISAFNIQAIVPPQQVSAAFLDVTTAKEQKDTFINEANGYYNSLIPQARAQANKTISDAEAYRQAQISKATGDTEKFMSMLKEYQNNVKIYTQDTTKIRLLLETLEKILPYAKMYIVDSANGEVDIKFLETDGIGTSVMTQDS